MLIDSAEHEAVVVVAFAGPSSAGKRSTLQRLEALAQEAGELFVPLEERESEDGDTILELELRPAGAGPMERQPKTRLLLRCASGRVFSRQTHDEVFACADVVVLVADSDPDRVEAAVDAREMIDERRRAAPHVPLVFQLNKRDLPGAVAVEALGDALRIGEAASVQTSALGGTGVGELKRLLEGPVLEQVRSHQALKVATEEAVQEILAPVDTLDEALKELTRPREIPGAQALAKQDWATAAAEARRALAADFGRIDATHLLLSAVRQGGAPGDLERELADSVNRWLAHPAWETPVEDWEKLLACFDGVVGLGSVRARVEAALQEVRSSSDDFF